MPILRLQTTENDAKYLCLCNKRIISLILMNIVWCLDIKGWDMYVLFSEKVYTITGIQAVCGKYTCICLHVYIKSFIFNDSLKLYKGSHLFSSYLDSMLKDTYCIGTSFQDGLNTKIMHNYISMVV